MAQEVQQTDNARKQARYRNPRASWGLLPGAGGYLKVLADRTQTAGAAHLRYLSVFRKRDRVP